MLGSLLRDEPPLNKQKLIAIHVAEILGAATNSRCLIPKYEGTTSTVYRLCTYIHAHALYCVTCVLCAVVDSEHSNRHASSNCFVGPCNHNRYCAGLSATYLALRGLQFLCSKHLNWIGLKFRDGAASSVMSVDVIALCTCIRNVPGSNLDGDADCPDLGLRLYRPAVTVKE